MSASCDLQEFMSKAVHFIGIANDEGTYISAGLHLLIEDFTDNYNSELEKDEDEVDMDYIEELQDILGILQREMVRLNPQLTFILTPCVSN